MSMSPIIARGLAFQKRKKWRGKRLKEQGNKCFYCGDVITFDTSTLDHLVPLSKGGRDHWENVAASCRSCNHNKGDMTNAEYRAELASRRRMARAAQ